MKLKMSYDDFGPESNATGLICSVEEGLTVQSFKEESDINEIVRRFGLTGEIPGDFKAPVSGDFVDVMDFQSAMNAVRSAQEAFDSLPGEVRYRFGNNPQRLMDFLDDGSNRDEAVRLGLVKAPEPLPVVAPPVADVKP